MNKKYIIIISFLAGALLFGGIPVIAASISASQTSSKIYVDNNQIYIDVYQIAGSNYFKLRDFCSAVNIGVWYDVSTDSVFINTKQPYNPNYTGPDLSITGFPAQTPVNIMTSVTVSNVTIKHLGYFEKDFGFIKKTGDNFIITNHNLFDVDVMYDIIGIKNDGTDVSLSSGFFSGIDKVQYEKDYKDNGWAVENNTIIVRSNNSLESFIEFTNYFISKDDLDVNKDGYYDIRFKVFLYNDAEGYIIRSPIPNEQISKIYSIQAH